MTLISEKFFTSIHKEVAHLHRPESFFCRLWNRNDAKLLHLTKLVERSLQVVEEAGVLVFDPDQETRSDVVAYQRQLGAAWKAALEVRESIFTVSVNASKELRAKGGEIQRLVIGNQYAVGTKNGGLDPKKEPDTFALSFLTEIAIDWKKQEALALSHELDSLELQQLREAACYSEWIQVLRENPWLRKPFMHFCLRDFNPVFVFICYPATADRLEKALLSTQLGYMRRTDREVLSLEILSNGDGMRKKVLTLPVYQGSDFTWLDPTKQERINILDKQQKVHFTLGNFTITVEEIFRQSQQKNVREAQINFSAFGFVNFHPHHGAWDPTQKKFITKWKTDRDLAWLHQIPPTRLVAQRELISRYGQEKITATPFFYKVMATRQKPDLTGLKCHAFLQIWLPIPKTEEWKVLDIGYYADHFPTGAWDRLTMMCGTLPGKVALIDQNGYYSQRQKAEVAHFPEDTEFRALSCRLLQQTREPRVFQFTGRNCAYSLQKLVQKVSGRKINYFSMSAENGRIGVWAIDQLLKLTVRVHRYVRTIIYEALRKCLGENRGISLLKKGKKKRYSVAEFYKKKGDVLFSPPFLHEQILQGNIEGRVYFGHTSERVPAFSEDESKNLLHS